MKGRPIIYSKSEMRWLEANRTLPIGEYLRRFRKKFGRDDASAVHLNGLRKRKGWKTGRTGCFERGMLPHNKGKPCPPGKGGRHPNARRTQFKKGQVPHTYRGPGYERIDKKDGYVIMIVAETNPWTGASTRPVHKHRWFWEKENGPIPDGHVLKCKDGDKTNCNPSNWELIPKALLPRLAGRWSVPFDSATDELKPTIMAVAKLEHAVREKRRSRKETQ